MKRYFIILAYLLIISSVVFAQVDSSAQGEEASTKTTEISLSGGITYPSLPRKFKDYWKKGINVSGSIGYSSPPGSLGYSALSLELTYNSFSFNENGFRSSLDTSKRSISLAGEATKTLAVMLTYRGEFSTTKNSIAPYFLLSVGYFHLSSGSVNVPSDTSLGISGENTSAIAWSFGGGIDVPVSDMISAFAEGRFVLGATGSDVARQYYPVSVGVRIKP